MPSLVDSKSSSFAGSSTSISGTSSPNLTKKPWFIMILKINKFQYKKGNLDKKKEEKIVLLNLRK